jgi:hypothetical protein
MTDWMNLLCWYIFIISINRVHLTFSFYTNCQNRPCGKEFNTIAFVNLLICNVNVNIILWRNFCLFVWGVEMTDWMNLLCWYIFLIMLCDLVTVNLLICNVNVNIILWRNLYIVSTKFFPQSDLLRYQRVYN